MEYLFFIVTFVGALLKMVAAIYVVVMIADTNDQVTAIASSMRMAEESEESNG